ncbi:MAG: VWA domain-containing protein, partial [Candidatus Sulfotelmatobacter sp.]
FTLKDDGHPETITLFSLQRRSAPAKENPIPAQGQTPFASAHTFSNANSSGDVPIVILMDLLNSSWENQPAIRSSLIASFERIPPKTPIALLILSEDLKLVSDFTTDTKSLTTLLQKPSALRQEGIGPALTATKTSNEKANETIMKSAIRAFNQEAGARLDRTVRALNLIRTQLSHMPGRKSLIWVGGGFTVGPHDWSAIRDVIDQFNDANVAVYTIDARGVLLDYGIGAEIDQTDLIDPLNAEHAKTRGDILDVIANSTGGVPYRNTNALDQAVLRAVDDNSTVYTLGFYPHHDDSQVKSHKIEVSVARPGVTLHYRSSYLITPQAAPKAEVNDNDKNQNQNKDQQQMLDTIIASPLEFSGLRFSVEALPGKKPGLASLHLHISPAELRLSMKDEKLTGALQLTFIQKRPSGDELSRKTSAFTFQLSSDQYTDAVEHTFSLTSAVKLHGNATKIRVLLRDLNSGRIGTVDVPVDAIPGDHLPDSPD